VVREDNEVKVDYRHPVTHQRVRAPLYDHTPEPGSRIRVVAENDDPMSIAVEGDIQLPLSTNAPLYGVFLFVACIPLLFRRFQIRRAERLAGSDATSFAMRGALFRSHFGRAQLALYALDAPANAAPVCSVRVLTTALAPQGQVVFPVEVKGSPRPLGRVVASFADEVLWPAGPALARRNHHGRPEHVIADATRLTAISNPRLAWRPAPWRLLGVPAALFAASAVFAAIVVVVTFHDAARSDGWFRDGRRTVGEVVDKSGEDTSVTIRYSANGETQQASAPVIYDSDFKTHVKYPIRVDRDDPTHIRLESEPYDRTGPIPWGLLPAISVGPWAIHRLVAWFRIRRAVRRGPWHRAEAAYDGVGFLDAALLGVRAGDHTVAQLQVAPRQFPHDERFELVVAGELDPGSAAAAWYERKALAPVGLVVVAEARPHWDDEWDDESDEAEEPLQESRLVEIKSFRFAWRKPRLEVVRGHVVLTLTSHFSEPWVIDADDVGAVDLTRSDYDLDDAPDALETPFLQTTGNFGVPTLLLLFKTPQRVPPVRWIMALGGNNGVPWGYRPSRSAEGAWADGIQLRASDPAAAVRAVTAAGGSAPRTPMAWLREERPELWSDALVAAIRATSHRRRNVGIAGGVLFAIGMGLLLITPDSASGWAFAGEAVIFIPGVALMFGSGFIGRRGSAPPAEDEP
jgi:hypothetical protein